MFNDGAIGMNYFKRFLNKVTGTSNKKESKQVTSVMDCEKRIKDLRPLCQSDEEYMLVIKCHTALLESVLAGMEECIRGRREYPPVNIKSLSKASTIIVDGFLESIYKERELPLNHNVDLLMLRRSEIAGTVVMATLNTLSELIPDDFEVC